MSKTYLIVVFGLLCLFVVVQAGVLTDRASNSASPEPARVGNEQTGQQKVLKESPKPGNAKPVKRLERLSAKNWGDIEVAKV